MDDDPQSTTQERVSIIISIETVHGEMYSIQHYMIKFPSDLRQVGGFLCMSSFCVLCPMVVVFLDFLRLTLLKFTPFFNELG
jgi:hypothetical protein